MKRSPWTAAGAFFSALLILLLTYIATGSVALGLEELLDQNWAGVSYATGIAVSGVVFAAVAAFAGVLALRGWNSSAFLRALQVAIGIAMACSVICSVWFIVSTGYFGWQGVIGVAFCLVVGGTVLGVLGLLRKDAAAHA